MGVIERIGRDCGIRGNWGNGRILENGRNWEKYGEIRRIRGYWWNKERLQNKGKL